MLNEDMNEMKKSGLINKKALKNYDEDYDLDEHIESMDDKEVEIMKNKIDSEKGKQGENKYIDKIRTMT